jgi:hypothetical protein
MDDLTASRCFVPIGPDNLDEDRTSAAGASTAVSVAEILERVELSQHLPLFEAEELTDVTVLCRMLARPEQLRAALKELGIAKMGQREKVIAALKEHQQLLGATSADTCVHACTGRDAPFLFSAAHRLLAHNRRRNGVQLLHRCIESVQVRAGGIISCRSYKCLHCMGILVV